MNKRLIREMRRKLHNTNGFTLSETLMTVVLIGLVTMAMAGGIVAARNVYQRISLRADAQTLLATTVSAITEDLSSVTSCDALQSSGSSQQEVTLIQSGTPTGSNDFFYAGDRGYEMQYQNGTYQGSGRDEASDTQKRIQVVPKGNAGGTIPLLPDKVQTRGLYAYIESLSVKKPQSNGDGGYFTLKIQIKNSQKEDQVVEEAMVCVHNKLK